MKERRLIGAYLNQGVYPIDDMPQLSRDYSDLLIQTEHLKEARHLQSEQAVWFFKLWKGGKLMTIQGHLVTRAGVNPCSQHVGDKPHVWRDIPAECP